VDIGAYEFQATAGTTPSLLVNPVLPGNGALQFSFTNPSGATFTVLASTDVGLPLSNWTVLGGVPETSPGQYQFTDPQAVNGPRRFYRVVGKSVHFAFFRSGGKLCFLKVQRPAIGRHHE
jgi:hypothetical protein